MINITSIIVDFKSLCEHPKFQYLEIFKFFKLLLPCLQKLTIFFIYNFIGF